MGYRTLAGLAVVLHVWFLLFLVVGGLVALRWRWVFWLHAASVAWGLGIVTVGQRCPLTSLERWATRRAGGPVYEGGFMDRYVKGVVYPGSFTSAARGLVALVVVGSWLALWCRRDARRPPIDGSTATATGEGSRALGTG